MRFDAPDAEMRRSVVVRLADDRDEKYSYFSNVALRFQDPEMEMQLLLSERHVVESTRWMGLGSKQDSKG
jgi:hypothetical protein